MRKTFATLDERRRERPGARLVRALLVLLGLGVPLWYACASSQQEIRGSGVSETTVTVSRPIKFKATGPMTFPSGYPGIGGFKLEPGVTIDVDLPAGGSVKLKDRVTFDGTNVIIGVVQQQRDVAVTPASLPTFDLALAVRPGSSYTWTVPELFGDTESVVQVTGSSSLRGPLSAVQADGAGGFTLDPRKLTAFSYDVSGGPAVFQAPMETPYGTIEGSGTIATSTGMVYGFQGSLSALSGRGTTGYVDPDGVSFDYGYTGAFPVRLDVGAGSATGTTTVLGGFDAFDVALTAEATAR